MPLFESRKAKTERLMEETLGSFTIRLASWLKDEDMPPEETKYYRSLYESWALGGSLAAGVVVERYDRLRQFWGKGDEIKATGITAGFTLGMGTAWYNEVTKREGRTEAERTEAITVAAENVCVFFDTNAPRIRADFLVVDRQLNYDLTKNSDRSDGGFSTWGHAMLVAFAEYLGGGHRPAFDRALFPIEDSAALSDIGVPWLDLAGITAVPLAFNLGADAMFEQFSRSRAGGGH